MIIRSRWPGIPKSRFTESVQQRFEAYGWHTQFVGSEFANDVATLDNAIRAARALRQASMSSSAAHRTGQHSRTLSQYKKKPEQTQEKPNRRISAAVGPQRF